MEKPILEVVIDILKFVNEHGISYMEEESFKNLYMVYHGASKYISSALQWLKLQGIIEHEHYLTRDYYKFNHEIDSVKAAILDEFGSNDCAEFLSEYSQPLDTFSKKCLSDENCKTVEDYKDMLLNELRMKNKTYKIHGKRFTMIDKDACDIIADTLLHIYENVFEWITIVPEGTIVKKSELIK